MTDGKVLIGFIVAGYGAIVATINSIVQIISSRRDRVDVVLDVRRNMQADAPRYAGMTLTLVTATNRGKRPARIEGFASKVLDSSRHRLPEEIRPQLPCDLSESQSVTAFINEKGHSQKNVESYFVWDSVGRHFYIHMAPWYRRVLSKFRQFLRRRRSKN